MATAPWDDLLSLESRLGETERQVRDSIRGFCDKRLMPGIIEANRHEQFDRDIFTDMGELGMLGATLPEEYGGPGLSHVCYGLIAREVEAGGLSLPFGAERPVITGYAPYPFLWPGSR